MTSALRKPLPALKDIAILRPGGNDTILVFDPVAEKQYSAVNAELLGQYTNVEQVMFVRQDGGLYSGTMAGHEFCANAVRALGYFLLDGKDGSIDVRSSGAAAPLRVDVRSGAAMAAMPIRQDWECVQSISDTITIVFLNGITHILCDIRNPLVVRMLSLKDRNQQKNLMLELMTDYNLAEEPCVGFIIVKHDLSNTAIIPFVYVCRTGTFYAETACGSATVAYGLKCAKQSRASCALDIMQPSGSYLTVTIDVIDQRLAKATLGGPVSILYGGPAAI